MLVIDDRSIEHVGQREAVDLLLVQVIDLSAAVDDVGPLDHHHQYEVDPVAMYAFRCGLAFGRKLGIDTELVDLDMSMGVRRQPSENSAAQPQNRCHGRAAQNFSGNRLEVACNVTVETVVGEALVMWLMGLYIHNMARWQSAQRGMPARSVMSAVRHIFVAGQIVPAILKRQCIVQWLSRAFG